MGGRANFQRTKRGKNRAKKKTENPNQPLPAALPPELTLSTTPNPPRTTTSPVFHRQSIHQKPPSADAGGLSDFYLTSTPSLEPAKAARASFVAVGAAARSNRRCFCLSRRHHLRDSLCWSSPPEIASIVCTGVFQPSSPESPELAVGSEPSPLNSSFLCPLSHPLVHDMHHPHNEDLHLCHNSSPLPQLLRLLRKHSHNFFTSATCSSPPPQQLLRLLWQHNTSTATTPSPPPATQHKIRQHNTRSGDSVQQIRWLWLAAM